MNFDIIQFLEDLNIPYDNNKEWINIQCPFCLDTEYHLGIHLKLGSINCWKCGTHKLPELIKEFTEKNPYEIIKKYKKGTNEYGKTTTTSGYSQTHQQNKRHKSKDNEYRQISLPIGIYDLTARHRRYLTDREFDPEELEKDWRVSKGTEGIGDYKFRIIIPIYHEGELVSYQGRDITGKQKDKYKTCYDTNIKNYLYGLDYVSYDKVIITEGVTDVWRLGKGNAVATFGINFTMKQVRLILKRKFKKIGLLFDKGENAQQQALILSSCLEAFGIDTHILELPKHSKDPADLSKEQVKKIINF